MATRSKPAKQAKHKTAGKTAKQPALKNSAPLKRSAALAKSAALKKSATPKQPAAWKKAASSKRPVAAKATTSRTAVRAKSPTAQAAAVATTQPDLYSSLHALLHTMRLIEQHDEPLCSMHDELKRTGKLSAAQRRRLQHLVDELPAQVYQDDLDTLRQAVAA